MKGYLILAEKKFEDIGTTEKKIKELILAGYISEARMWFRHAKFVEKDGSNSCNAIAETKAHLILVKKKPEDIETSEEKNESPRSRAAEDLRNFK